MPKETMKPPTPKKTSFEAADFVRWRTDPAAFITEVLRNPKDHKPFVLYRAQLEFLKHAFQLDDGGRLLYPELVFSMPKKSGKSAFAAMLCLYAVIVLAPGGEAILCANDFEQSQGRVFKACCDIVKASPLLKGRAKISANKIFFPGSGAIITAIASEYAGAAGSGQNLAVFDELWGYTSERSKRLFDEMLPPPIHKIAFRLTGTYAGFFGESLLLWSLYERGMALPEIGPDLHAGDGLLFHWGHSYAEIPWVSDRWVEQQRRPPNSPSAFAQKILNQWTSSENAFIERERWEACIDPALSQLTRNTNLHIWVGVDASVNHDASAIVCVTREGDKWRVVRHRCWYPSPAEPLDYENTIEAELRYLRDNFFVRQIYFDPFQMVSTAERLRKEGYPIEKLVQSQGLQTRFTSNFYELIYNLKLTVYPSDELTNAVVRCVTVEDAKGHQRLAKVKTSHKIDAAVALAMAPLAAVEEASESTPAIIQDQRKRAEQAGMPAYNRGDQLERCLANPNRQLKALLESGHRYEATRMVHQAGACAFCGRYFLEDGVVRGGSVGPDPQCGDCASLPTVAAVFPPSGMIVCTKDTPPLPRVVSPKGISRGVARVLSNDVKMAAIGGWLRNKT
jgi:hypothetical protein